MSEQHVTHAGGLNPDDRAMARIHLQGGAGFDKERAPRRGLKSSDNGTRRTSQAKPNLNH
jgi:hypothetical protein